MILTTVILSAGLLVGAGLVVVFWNNIISYLKKLIDRIKTIVQGTLRGVKVFLRKTTDRVIQITKNYSKDMEKNKWYETVVKRELSENEIPREIRERLIMDDEFDITDELELTIANAG